MLLNKIFVRDRSFYRSFALLAGALILEQMVILSVNLADNVMLGSYSETSLSGVAAVNQIQFVLQQLVHGVSNGMIVLGSQYWGQQRVEPIRKLVGIGSRCAMGVIAVLFAFVSLFPHVAVGMFTPDEAIIREGMAYLSIIRFSYPFFALTTVMLGSLRTVEHVRIALIVSVCALVTNCAINFVLIPGRFGFPELGVRGAAIGTLTARVLECGIVLVYILRDKLLKLRVRDFLHADRDLFRDYVRVSIPVILTAFLWGVNTALQTVVMGHMSSSAMAAQSISSTLFLFLKVTAVGGASAASILIGKAVGSGDMARIKSYTRTLQVLFIGIGTVMCLIMLAVRLPLLSLYTLTPETYELSSRFMLVEATVLFCTSYQMSVNTGIIRGGGDTKFVLILDIIVIWGVVIPLSFLAAFVWELPPLAVLVILNGDQYFKCIPAALYGNSYRWIKHLTREEIGTSGP